MPATLSNDAKRRALARAAASLASTELAYDPASLAFVVSVLDVEQRNLARSASVVFRLPRAGWVSFAFEGEIAEVRACDLVGAQRAHAILSLPAGSGVVHGSNPNGVRNALRLFADFAQNQCLAGRALSQAVRCIVVSKGVARFNPRAESAQICAR